jgi:hypothetical protein
VVVDEVGLLAFVLAVIQVIVLWPGPVVVLFFAQANDHKLPRVISIRHHDKKDVSEIFYEFLLDAIQGQLLFCH